MTSTEISPAERFAAARRRSTHPLLEQFRHQSRFDFDRFQEEACASLEEGKSVLVAAPTGAGKTLVAEFAVYLALHDATSKVFYTTPMKALSNQKFHEFVDAYGPDSVGLLTGDTNINSGARIVVMTTEVLRNMLYADSDLLENLAFVVLDEVHYLADRFRGAVWEEVIIHLPEHIRMVSLSATVSNAEEFGDWLHTVRGDTDVIVSEERPVPLQQHILLGSRLIDLFHSGSATDDRVNPELVEHARVSGRGGGPRSQRSSYVERAHRRESPRFRRSDVIHLLEEHTLLPAIFFIFSRVGCESAVSGVLQTSIRLTDAHERETIREIVDERCRNIPDEDLSVLGFWQWRDALERGVAAHHAGLLPAFKEVVEELFQRKLVKVVFATETLALGINMPARTVVLEKLEKFNGEARVPITSGEYTQLTGRAGRRGIDVEGHSVIQWGDSLDPHQVASLASRRSYPLVSSFRPTYNMAANLIDQFGRDRAREILESSFAQFQADRAVVNLATKVRDHERSLAGYEKAFSCHLGDYSDYARLRRELNDLEKQGKHVESLSKTERDRRSANLSRLRKLLKEHPCHNCSEREDHARWSERWWRLTRQTDQLRKQIRSRTGAIASVFDRVCAVLITLGYLEDHDGQTQSTVHGRTLKRIYGERDLLIAECLRRGTWKSLDAPSLAAMACALVFESRRDERLVHERVLPRGPFRPALDRTLELWARLDDLERDNGLSGSELPSASLSLAMHMWAKGSALDTVLHEAELSAGDFVRWAKQTIDLCDQLSNVAAGSVAITARAARDAIRRGIVAYSIVA